MVGQSSKKARGWQFESEGFYGERGDEGSSQPVRREVCRLCGGARAAAAEEHFALSKVPHKHPPHCYAVLSEFATRR